MSEKEKRRMGIEWVEIIEPRTRDFMYANLATGECVWDPPEGVEIKRSDDNQWWELFDVNTRRFYYYNVASHTTVWHRPLNSDIIPLAKLQCLKQFSGDFTEQPRRPEGIPSQSTKKKSYSSASGEFDATYENQQTLDRNSKCAHRKQITSGVSDSGGSGTGCRSLRLGSASRHPCMPPESSSAHNVPYAIGATSSDYEHRLEQDLSPNYPFAAGGSSSNSAGGVPVHSTSTPQLKKKYNHPAPSTPGSGYGGGGGRGDGMASLKQHRNNSDVEHNSSASITRSGSFVSSPHTQQPKMALRTPRNANARDLLGGGGGVNSDDDSMHEKYFKSVENTPQSRRRNTAVCSHSKHSSDSSPQSPHGGAAGVQPPAKVSSKSGSRSAVNNSNHNTNMGLDTSSTNRSSRAGGSGSRHKLLDETEQRADLMEKPEKYLDKMLLHRDKSNSSGGGEVASGGGGGGSSSGGGGRHLHAQMKLPLNVDQQFVSKTATITSQSQQNNNNNNTMGSLSQRGTSSRISPKCVSPGSQELSLSKSNLDRHNRDLAQTETQLKLKKRSPANTGVKAMTPKAAKPPPSAKHRETRTNTYASDVDYDAGNMSPLYSNWDQEHLLPLQHYIIEQAKLSKYQRYYATNTDDSVDSDSLHSDSQSEHSLSGHEPDNEDSDHSESRGDYLTYHQHYMAEDADQSKQNYYNVFDKNGKEDFRSSEVEAQLESVRDNLYSPVQNNQFFNPVLPISALGGGGGIPHSQAPPHPLPPLHHSQSMVDGGGGVGPMASAGIASAQNTQSRLSPMRQLQRSLQTHAQPGMGVHVPPPLPTGPSASIAAALKFFNEAEYPNQPIYGTQFGPVAPLAIMKETDIEKFAQDNLNLHAKGIFRKKSSVRDMLSWTADAISRPMLALARDKAGKKIAIEMFKLVQIYMGDRKARQGMSLNSVAIDIITLGVMQPALRDELYVQLCRQTTENPSRESMIRGWELMAICLSFLSPSPTFQPALLNYMNRHHDPTFATSFPEFGKWPIHVQVSHYAKVACKRLERIGSSGKRPTKKPSEDEVNQARMQIFRDSMFGNTLEEVMLLQRERFPNRQLPWVQVMLSEQVVMMGGKETEGIFRVPADLDEIGMVKSRLDQWEIPDIPSMDAHTPACLLKLWYRELYDPLIPDDLYEECIQTDDPAAVAQIVEKLSPINRLVLTYLIHFLQEFSQPDVVTNTKMDSSNLAMVFAPNCLRCRSQDPKVILENTRKEMAFLRTLITTMDTKQVKNML